jgi:hypothetical protein
VGHTARATQGDGGSFVAPAGWYWYSRSMGHGAERRKVAGGDGMNDVTKGFRDRRFLSLSERDKRDILKLMARGS